MKKIITLFVGVCLVGIFTYVWAAEKYTRLNSVEVQQNRDDYQKGLNLFNARDINKVLRFRINGVGGIASYDSSGNTVFSIQDSDYVNINSYTQLSSWTGNGVAAGASYFNLQPGKKYLVDLHAIWKSGCNPVSGGTGFAQATVLSAVSAIMFDASTYSGLRYAPEIILVSTLSGAPNVTAGLTTLQVWPYAGSAATSYGKGKSVRQTQLAYINTNGTGTSSYGVGVSYWMLDRTGESTTFLPSSAGVSVTPIKWSIH